MYNKKPPFEITTSILDKMAEIAELVGQVNAVAGLTTNPMLRRTNRIRSVYSSLAIEQNTLSLEQVTAVLNGKRVIARFEQMKADNTLPEQLDPEGKVAKFVGDNYTEHRFFL